VVSDRLEQQIMRDAVEERLDVEIEHPVLLPATSTGMDQRVMGRTPRTVAIAVGMEDRLELLLQQPCGCGLRYPVCQHWHAERPDPRPMILRYLHRPHRRRQVTARAHPVPQLVEVVPHIAAEVGDADGVHARRPAVGSDLLPRLNDEVFGDLKRLSVQR
jgi:hypothetical protein